MQKNQKNIDATSVIIGLSAVMVCVDKNEPKVFVVRGNEHALDVGMEIESEKGDALPFGPFNPEEHETLERGLRKWVKDQTPLVPGYVEQLYTFGNKGRYAGQKQEGPRVISIGYLALTYQEKIETDESLFWGGWYDYFPWEDWRQGKPSIIKEFIEPALSTWVEAAKSQEEQIGRQARMNLCFAFDGVAWDEEKTLERYELLYEARLLEEAVRDKKMSGKWVKSKSMLYDHRRILATAIGRLRGKLKYRPVVFELMPDEFTLLDLQKTVEAIMGHSLHKQNFRRFVEASGMVEEIEGRKSAAAGGRPAALYCFRREALLERSAPGVRLSSSHS